MELSDDDKEAEARIDDVRLFVPIRTVLYGFIPVI